MRALALLLGLIACHSTAAARGTGPTLRMFQAISHLSTGQDTHGLTLYDELQQCWGQIDPALAQVSDQFWSGFFNYSTTNGSGADFWGPQLGGPCPFKKMGPDETSGGYKERNSSAVSVVGSSGATQALVTCEPCDSASNWAFYRVATRFCARATQRAWNMSTEMQQAIVRGAAWQAGGSAFMHFSDTTLGGTLDTRSENSMMLLFHQNSISQLPGEFSSSSVLLDVGCKSCPRGVEATQMLYNAFTSQPVDRWLTTANQLSDDLSRPIAGIVSSFLALALPDGVVDLVMNILQKILPTGAGLTTFLREHYLPTFRNATKHVELSFAHKLQVVRVGIGAWIKFMYAVLWQEELLKWHYELISAINKLGANLMPAVNKLADALTGFNDAEPVVRDGGEVYPGASWCRASEPHALWHELCANGFYDVLHLSDYLAAIYRGDGVSSTNMPAARVSTLLAELDSQFISGFDELAVDTASEAHHKQLMEASRRIRSWLGELEFIWGAAIGLIR